MNLPARRTRVPRAVLGLCVLAVALLPSSAADGQGAAARSRWWDEVDEARSLLDEENWQKAARRAERVREELLRTSWREPDLGDVLAELAFQAAVARANLGEQEQALWEWWTALIHERARGRHEIAGRDLSGHGRAVELLAGIALRAAGEAPPGSEPASPRPDREWEAPAPPEGFALEPLENTGALQERPPPALIEVWIDREGALRHPVLVSSWNHPVVVQWALDNLRRASRFQPARMEGETVEVLWQIQLDLRDAAGGRSRRR